MRSFIHLLIQEMFNTSLTERIEKVTDKSLSLRSMATQGWEEDSKQLSVFPRLYIVSSSKNCIISVFCKNIKIDKRLSNMCSKQCYVKKKNKNMPKAVNIFHIGRKTRMHAPGPLIHIIRGPIQYTKYVSTHSKQINSKLCI